MEGLGEWGGGGGGGSGGSSSRVEVVVNVPSNLPSSAQAARHATLSRDHLNQKTAHTLNPPSDRWKTPPPPPPLEFSSLTHSVSAARALFVCCPVHSLPPATNTTNTPPTLSTFFFLDRPACTSGYWALRSGLSPFSTYVAALLQVQTAHRRRIR